MHEVIGGEFAIDKKLLSNNKENKELQYSSGRSVLYSILMHVEGKHKKILLPAYLCDSITRTVIETGWKYTFYQINEFLHPIIDDDLCSTLKECDAILLINYFGMVDLKNDIASIRNEGSGIFVIEDDVQAFYSLDKTSADCSFTSLRKWFPCPDGALLHMNSSVQVEPCVKTENKWSQYKLAGNLLKEQSDYVDDSIILSLLSKGEDLLDNSYLSYCSKASINIFSNLDLEKIAHRRKQNAKILHCELKKLGIKHMYSDNAIPLFIPVFVDNRDELRREFFSQQVFTPNHWPKISDEVNGINTLYTEELSLICDQRYCEKDMMKQINILKRFLYRMR